MTATTARGRPLSSVAATCGQEVVNPVRTRPDSSRLALICPSAIGRGRRRDVDLIQQPEVPRAERQGAKPGQSADRFLGVRRVKLSLHLGRNGGRIHGWRPPASWAGAGTCSVRAPSQPRRPSGEARERRGHRGSRDSPPGNEDAQHGQAHGCGPEAAAARSGFRRDGTRADAGGRSGAATAEARRRAEWRAPALREALPAPGDPPGGSGQAARGLRNAPLKGPEPFDPPLPRRSGEGAPRQQLRDDRRVDRDREIHRFGHGAAMNGGRQLGGRGPQPAVLMKSGFQRRGQRPPELQAPAAAAAAAARPARERVRSGSTSPAPRVNTHHAPAAVRPGRRPPAPGSRKPSVPASATAVASATMRATPRSARSGLPCAVNSTLPGETSPCVKP